MMKTKSKFFRVISITLVLTLLLSVGALASVLGDEIDAWNTRPASGAALARGVYWTGSDYRSENIIEMTRGGTVYPIVASGETVHSGRSFQALTESLAARGLHVVAGINGDYYTLSNYEPVGILLKEGKLLSSDGGFNAVGFREDGSAIIGMPRLVSTLSSGGSVEQLFYINKTREAGDLAFFTSEFAQTTGNTKPGRDVILSPVSGQLSMSGSLTLTVTEVKKTSDATAIPAGGYILSLADTAPSGQQAFVDKLTPGSQLTLTTSCNEGWGNVKYALGSLYRLVSNGQVASGLDQTAAPRTAVGVKADGTLVLYTIDGRQPGKSVGASMTQVAQRLIELGCVDATIMDGGGSTSLSSIYIGDSSISQINSPSDGNPRTVSNYIMLVTAANPTGTADRLQLYPLSAQALKGATINFELRAADMNGYAAAPPAGTTLSVSGSLGEISPGGALFAGSAGQGEVSASAPGTLSGSSMLRVVETPDSIQVFDESSGANVSALTLSYGQTLALGAKSSSNHVSLISEDTCYSWSLPAEVGTVSADGTIVAGTVNANGTLTVSAGGKSITIPVSVQRAASFTDVKPGDWFFDPVEYAVEKGLLKGVGDGLFAPLSSLNRAMLVTILYRAAGSPEVSGGSGFGDVPEGEWYSAPIAWAAANGVVEGMGSGQFAPTNVVTREQFATILMRYFGGTAGENALNFTDAASVSGWAIPGMSWAVSNGYIRGTDSGLLNPLSGTNRAEAATILSRCF